MRLSVSKRIVLEDLPAEVRSWFGTVTSTLNPFLEGTYKILTGGVTLRDNLKAQLYEQTLQPGQSSVRLSYTLNEKPSEVRIASIRSPNGVTSPFSLVWKLVNGTLEIELLGLDPAKKHYITLVAQV